MLAINVSIPNLLIAHLVQFWPWQHHVNTSMLTTGLLKSHYLVPFSK